MGPARALAGQQTAIALAGCSSVLATDSSEGSFTPREGRAAARAAPRGPGGPHRPCRARRGRARHLTAGLGAESEVAAESMNRRGAAAAVHAAAVQAAAHRG